MKNLKAFPVTFLAATLFAVFAATAKALTLTNPIVFVTQPPIWHEINGSVSNAFLSVVTIFGNQQADTAHAARGGDLWLMTTNQTLVNLTRKGGFGTNGIQHGIGIDVRDPQIHWSGKKILFSMVVGTPTNATDTSQFYWQLYEVTNLDAVIANPGTTAPAIVNVPNQPTNYNNVTPCYATDGRIIFMSDRPYDNQSWLYPALDEYKGQPTVCGIYSLDPVSGDFKMIEHLPSGAFNPFIDSFGRLIVTRWDHLSQDPIATDDLLGITNLGSSSLNGSFNFLTETPGSLTQSTNISETFPELRNFDPVLGVNANEFNLFLPWAIDQTGGSEEVLNHVGRHELFVPSAAGPFLQSFTGDTNLVSISNLVQRIASGVVSVNTNNLSSMFQITEDPRTNGLYWGVQAVDISPFGGTHASGQIVTLSGGMGVNPENMAVTYITPVAGAAGPTSLGLYRNPLPMSDGTLIAAFTDSKNGIIAGADTNIGTTTLPVSRYHFRLMTLTNSGGLWGTNQFLTGGIQSTSIFWQGNILVTNSATLWELQPVEVRARLIPAPVVTGVAPIEQQVFAEEGVDLPTFQADLAQRGLALVVSRNVTARDAADKQQPYNLQVPGGVSSIANSGKVYDITHLQFMQADYLRGYTNGPNGLPMPGRRILAIPLHASSNFNYVSSKTNAPPGGTEIMSDGSQATFIPANRAVTWQFTGDTNESVVKERYWISFRPGEVRTCANCHGINSVDQLGRPTPTNAPFALRQLLRLWKTNAANAYLLTVTNGNSGGSFGAGSLVTLTANPAPSGKVFVGWTGSPGIGNTSSNVTSFIMPATNASVIAVYTNLPAPVFTGYFFTNGTNLSLSAQAYANQPWILQSSTDLFNWVNVSTNTAAGNQLYQVGVPVNGAGVPKQFFRLVSP